MNNPMKLIHSELLFEYFVDATPVIAECPTATGRDVPPTAIPFAKPTSASTGHHRERSDSAAARLTFASLPTSCSGVTAN